MRRDDVYRRLCSFMALLLVLSSILGLVTPDIVHADGDGSTGNPYTVAEAMTNQSQNDKTVIGYIVGTTIATDNYDLEADFTVETNIAIADSPTETDPSKIMPVALPSGTIRSALNLKNNPGNLSKKVKITGDLMAYFSRPGLKNSDAYEFVIGPDTAAPVITHTPVTVGVAGSPITITTTIDDASTVTAAVYYGNTVNGTGFENAVIMTTSDSETYTADIPAHGAGTLYYYIAATDSSNNSATSPSNIANCNLIVVSATDLIAPTITHTAVTTGVETVDITINATIDDTSTVSAAVYYGDAADGNGFTNYVVMENTADNIYEAIIENPAAGDLYYYIKATDSNNNIATNPVDISSSNKITVSEIMATAEARTKSANTKVSVKGIATYSTQNRTIFMQDSSGGICIDSGSSSINISGFVGKEIIVTGTITLYGGMVQVKPSGLEYINVTDAAPTVPDPLVVSINTLNNSDRTHEGKLIKVENAKIKTIGGTGTGTYNHIVTQGIDEITLRAGALTGKNVGDYITIRGVVGYYNSPQIQAKTADITAGIAPPVESVTATPVNNSTIPLGGTITLSTATAGASIVYTLNGGAEQTIAGNSGTVTIDQFNQTGGKAIIIAKATNGSYTTPEVTFTFTQAKAAAVTANPAAGPVSGTSHITLTAGESATIRYIVTKKAGVEGESSDPEATYTASIQITEDMLPVNITAYATMDKYLQSDSTTFRYYLASNEPYKNYFGQLHSHTTNSDGAGTLTEAFEWARDNAELDFFAVTDHSNSFDTAPAGDKAGTYNLGAYNSGNEKWQNGKAAAAAAAVPGEYVSFYGYEMTWSGGPGHMNTFATEGFVSRNNSELNSKTNDAGLRAYYELLKLHPESISQFNHPGTTFGNFSGFAYYDPVIDERITLIEVGNGEGAIGSGGYFPSFEQYDMALDKGWHVAPTNNQDNHKALWGNANTARTVIYTNDFTTEGIYQAMRDMRVYATEDANLDIVYTLNGEKLGTVLETVPETATFRADAKNIAGSNKVESIAIITNGGVEAYKENFGTAEATLDYVMEAPTAGYYYIKVVQEDGRIAVTAPVWLGEVESVGISELSSSSAMPVTTEELTLSTTVFNNENTAVTLDSIKYQVKGGAVIADNTLNTTIQGSATHVHTQAFTPTTAKKTTIIVTANIDINGTVKAYTKEIELNVRDIKKLNFIGIDASHLNEYVAGNYKDSMGNFSIIAMKYGLRTVTLNTSEEFIAATANPKFKMFVITAPTRRLEPASNHKNYSDEEIDAIAAFAKQGKPVIITGWGDYYESYDYVATGLENHMAWQQNKLLEAIGATLRLGDDEAKDNVTNGGQPQRLYLNDYNGMVSLLLKGLLDGQKFSQYGGCTLYAVNPDGTPATTLPASVTPIVSGHSTTYSSDDDKDGYGFEDPAIKVPRYGDSPDAGQGAGKVLIAASETLNHDNGVTSQVIVSGGAFMSNFEVKNSALDNAADAYSNENILHSLLSTIENITITPITQVKTAEEGTEFTIEGIATVSVYDGTSDNNTGFFDSIYVQDATAGINLFPVASGVQAGQRIRVTGVVSSYQGELQLAVSDIKVLDEEINPVTPTVVSTHDATAASNTGKLIKTTGVVTHIVAEPNGLVNQITLDDGTGPAIAYINAYITPNKSLSFVNVGATISVTGLGSVGENFTSDTEFLPRIRVRDRGEIELAAAATYTVTFDSQGGTAVAAVTDIAPNTTITLPTAPIRPGYTFAGWFTERNGAGTAFKAGTVITSNMTVYAKWIKNEEKERPEKPEKPEPPAPPVTPPTPPVTPPVVPPAPPVIPPTPPVTPPASVFTAPQPVTVGVDNSAVGVTQNGNAAQVTVQANAVAAAAQSAQQQAAAAANGGAAVVAITPQLSGNISEVSVQIPGEAIASLAQNNVGLAINTSVGSVQLSPEILGSLPNSGNVNLSIRSANPETEIRTLPNGMRPVGQGIDLVLGLDRNNASGGIVIEVTVGDDANGDLLGLYYYNEETGELTFVGGRVEGNTLRGETTHNSKYFVMEYNKQFKDTKANSWYSKYVDSMAAKYVMGGYSDETFRGTANITRGEFAVALVKALGLKPAAYKGQFKDVGSKDFYAGAIQILSDKGIMTGSGKQLFNPKASITREEIFAIVGRTVVVNDAAIKANIKGYEDAGGLSSWAVEGAEKAVASKIITGDGKKLNPQSRLSRYEAAVILYRLYNK